MSEIVINHTNPSQPEAGMALGADVGESRK